MPGEILADRDDDTEKLASQTILLQRLQRESKNETPTQTTMTTPQPTQQDPQPTPVTTIPTPPTVIHQLTVQTDDDMDEPLGKACSIDNPDCESCQ